MNNSLNNNPDYKISRMLGMRKLGWIIIGVGVFSALVYEVVFGVSVDVFTHYFTYTIIFVGGLIIFVVGNLKCPYCRRFFFAKGIKVNPFVNKCMNCNKGANEKNS